MSKSLEKIIYDRTKCEQIMDKLWMKCERKWILMWVWVNLGENLMKIIDRKW